MKENYSRLFVISKSTGNIDFDVSPGRYIVTIKKYSWSYNLIEDEQRALANLKLLPYIIIDGLPKNANYPIFPLVTRPYQYIDANGDTINTEYINNEYFNLDYTYSEADLHKGMRYELLDKGELFDIEGYNAVNQGIKLIILFKLKRID